MRPRLLSAALLALAALPTLAPGAAAANQPYEVFLHDRLHIAPDRMAVNVGDVVQLTLRNPDFQNNTHGFEVEGYDKGIDPIEPGGTQVLTFTADKPGEFTYYCPVPGHKQGGMRGTLVVQGAAASEKESPAPAVALAIGGMALTALAFAGRRRA